MTATNPPTRHFAAIDLGASSGRVMHAALTEGRLSIEEVHRFVNRAVHVPISGDSGRWCWDTIGLWDEIVRGLGKLAAQVDRIDAIGIDSWGVDYVLLDGTGQMVRPSIAYRDPRNDASMRRVQEQLGAARLYEATGTQFMPFNTIYQLAADADDPGRPLERAETMLMTPQLLSFWLTGERCGEHTMASTTQVYDVVTRRWLFDFADELGIPRDVFPEVVDDAAVIGHVRPALAESIGLKKNNVPVIAVGSHDTASAVVASPMTGPGSAYLSSGTWSLLGIELDEPCRTEAARAANLTNEAGIEGNVRCLRNIAGLWLLQESRRVWAEAGNEYGFAELAGMAERATPFAALVAPDDARFAPPGDMPHRLSSFCHDTGQTLPDDPGAMARCIFESLAARYAQSVADIDRITGHQTDTLHIVGGGSNNQLLNQLAADACGLPVTTGPGEATAIGNALVQAIALGDVADQAEARQIVRDSFPSETLEPGSEHSDRWAAAVARLDSWGA